MKTQLCDNCLTPLEYYPKVSFGGKYYIAYQCPKNKWYNGCVSEELYKSFHSIMDDYYRPDQFENLVAAQNFINELERLEL